MKKLIREVFLLGRGERRGLLAVGLLLLFSLIFRWWVYRRPVPPVEMDPSFIERMKEIQGAIDSIDSQNAYAMNQPEEISVSYGDYISFFFDPNKLSLDSLLLLGIPEFVANNIIRYRKSGGSFTDPAGLEKIYGMDSVTLDRILPFVEIPPPALIKKETFAEKKVDAPIHIDLNTADSSQLMLLPGIGPSWSSRIVGYRTLLGGFYESAQLWEVYGMDSLRYRILSRHTFIDSSGLEKIRINAASFRQLVAHPYLNKAETYALLTFRDFADTIKSIDQLKLNQVIDSERLERIAPYLSFAVSKDSSDIY